MSIKSNLKSIIAVRDLNFSFDKKKSKSIFRHLNLEIQTSECTVLLGSSGSGKSTLIRLLAGLLNPTSKKSFVERNFQNAGFVFQEPNLLSWLTAFENIALPWTLSGQSVDSSNIENWAHRLKIADILNQYPHQLSGGQKMRVSIARALITQPEILFMDEPFSALDEITRFELQDIIKSLRQDRLTTILFVTHSIAEACYLADRIVLIGSRDPFIIETVSNTLRREDPQYFTFQNTVQKIFYDYVSSKNTILSLKESFSE